LLIDSGGQYKTGTTDITRTLALDKPTKEQQLHYTMVLKGNIALSMVKFPAGTRGVQLDTLARQFLWQHGLNYGHGTGHGVGYFLNVHEPPQGFIGGLGERGVTTIEKGMLTSNEPGFYVEGSHGIRIENLVLTVEDEKTPYGEFLKFETVTLFPIDKKLINTKYLSNDEKKWLNKYHDEVFEAISPYLNKKETKWLKEKTKHLK
jgi:Xaa-Pro aminopeptidase